MTNIILCDVTASVSELKNDPVASAGAGCGYPVAIMCKFTQILQLPQNTKGGIARC